MVEAVHPTSIQQERPTLRATATVLARGILASFIAVACASKEDSDNFTPEHVTHSTSGQATTEPEASPVVSKPTEVPPVTIVLNERERVILREFLAEDLKGYTEGWDTLFGRSKAESYAVVSANELQKEYERNEVAGDKKFRGKHIVLSGTIASIDRSIGENYFVSLKGGSNQFMRPKAMMADGQTDFLADLDKGQTIRLVCKGDGMLMGSAMVSECIPTATWIDREVSEGMRKLPELLRANDAAAMQLLVVAVMVTMNLKETSPCWSEDLRQEGRCAKELTEAMDRKGKGKGKGKADTKISQGVLSRLSVLLGTELQDVQALKRVLASRSTQ